MELNPKVAVFDGRQFTNCKLEKTLPVEETPENLGELAQLALDANLTHVWVLPGTPFSKGISRAFVEQSDERWDTFASYPKEWKDRPVYARVWPKGVSGWAGRTIRVGFCESDLGVWSWECPDVITLLATLTYLEDALGAPIEWSPGHIGLDLLKAYNLERRASWLRPVSIDWHALPVANGTFEIMSAARDLSWRRPLTSKEKRMAWLHKIDKNSMYLAAATGALVGEGEPSYAEGDHYTAKVPGIWYVHVDPAASLYDGKGLPSPARTEWMCTDNVECCRRLGYHVEILEGYCWGETEEDGQRKKLYHRTLETWATSLWNVRQSLDRRSPAFQQQYKHELGRKNAYVTIKNIATITVGKLADDDTPGQYYRPDIWAMIVGRSFSNIFYNLEALRLKEIAPALIITDAFWVVSNDPLPESAVPLIDTHKLGGFKHVYSLPMSKEIHKIFAEVSPGRIAKLLNALARQSNESEG